MRYICISLLCLMLFSSCNNEVRKTKETNNKDSIQHFVSKEGLKLKTIVYPSKQKDSFHLKVNYVNGKLKDSGYITDKGFRLGNLYTSYNDSIDIIYEYLNLDKENYLNQYWAIQGQDTLTSFGDNYRVQFFESNKGEDYFQAQVLLRSSNSEDLTKLFFLAPKGNHSNLKDNFSNYKEIEYDTFPSLIDDGIPNDDTYGDYWAKRLIVFGVHKDDVKQSHFKGILIKRVDTIIDKVIQHKDRYLFVKKEVNVTD